MTIQIQYILEWLSNELQTTYSLPLWLILIISLLSFVYFIQLLLGIQFKSKPEYLNYTQDSIYGTNWKWKWEKDKIFDIQCYCPKCDATLIYDETSIDTKHTELSKTDFICENCNSSIITSIHGGNKNYAINAVKREIERRIRTNEYKTLEKN